VLLKQALSKNIPYLKLSLNLNSYVACVAYSYVLTFYCVFDFYVSILKTLLKDRI